MRGAAEKFGSYDWSGRAISRHQGQTRAAFGFRECAEEDQAQLAEWLASELCPVELSGERLVEAGLARCRKQRLERPAFDDRPEPSGCGALRRTGPAVQEGRVPHHG